MFINTRIISSPLNWLFVAIVFTFVMMTLHHFFTAKEEA